jgi:hypothetical protein
MELMMFSHELQAVLRQQGWSPERKVPTHHWVAELVGSGFTVLPEAESILQNFGGLKIIPVKTRDGAYATGIIKFDPVTDVLSEVERIEFWQKYLGKRLTPLGVLYPSESILLISDNGQVFCEWGNLIGECGNSFEDALESTLVFARRRPVIHKLDADGKLRPVE